MQKLQAKGGGGCVDTRTNDVSRTMRVLFASYATRCSDIIVIAFPLMHGSCIICPIAVNIVKRKSRSASLVIPTSNKRR